MSQCGVTRTQSVKYFKKYSFACRNSYTNQTNRLLIWYPISYSCLFQHAMKFPQNNWFVWIDIHLKNAMHFYITLSLFCSLLCANSMETFCFLTTHGTWLCFFQWIPNKFWLSAFIHLLLHQQIAQHETLSCHGYYGTNFLLRIWISQRLLQCRIDGGTQCSAQMSVWEGRPTGKARMLYISIT